VTAIEAARNPAGRQRDRVLFALPTGGGSPVGGYKVVYEYANALARRGFRVAVVHPQRLRGEAPRRPLDWARYLAKGIRGWHRPDGWFEVDRRVRLLWTPDLAERWLPGADFVVATSWETAEWVAGYSPRLGDKLYLIQHLETWSGPAERVLATWRLPLRKVVISRWLQETAAGLGERAHYIPNGLDFGAFGVDVDPARRAAATVIMLLHDLPWKGSADGLAALRIARQSLPDLRVLLFGVGAPPPDLPDWIEHFRNPRQAELRALYNRAAIFLSPSWAEGWPLPPAEAMMSGCACVLTDIGGHREYGRHERTALLAPARDPAALARAVVRFAEAPRLRLQVSAEGARYISQFTWDRAVQAFIAVLQPDRDATFSPAAALGSPPP
jgi:glycosyltransferase involved in cell wall biosynthesis